MNTIENNKFVAQFMGLELEETIANKMVYAIKMPNYIYEGSPTTEFFEPEELLYNVSWDWLIPVVEKIEKLGYSVDYIKGDYFIFNKDGILIIPNPMHEDKNKVGILFELVCNFIQWYNLNK